MLEGITSGFILSLTLFPGAVWLVKVARAGGPLPALAVAGAFFLSQVVWLTLAATGLMLMYVQLFFMRGGIHLFAAFVLAYAGIKFLRCPRATGLDAEEDLPPAGELFSNAFRRSLGMPMRLPLAVALLIATGSYVNHVATPATALAVAAGGVIGTAIWWGELLFLAVVFGKRVPAPISLKSLNKIRPFSGILFLALAGIAVLIAN